MGFIDDDKVEATNTKRLVFSVEIVYHRLIGREEDACLHVRCLFFAQYRHRNAWQQGFVVFMCLTDECRTVCKKEYILHPVITHEDVAERYTHTCLARSCC